MNDLARIEQAIGFIPAFDRSPLKTCTKCGTEKPVSEYGKHSMGKGGLNPACRVCHNKQSKEWADKNKERKRLKSLEWNSLHKEQMKAAKRRYLDTPQGKNKSVEYSKYYRKANPSKVKDSINKWRTENAFKIKEYSYIYRSEHKSERCVLQKNRHAKKLSIGGNLSKDISPRLFILQRGKCACCGLPLGDNYHLDHIMPLALGGSNEDSNIQLLRQRCNGQKHAKHPVDFMQSRGFLL